MSTAIDSALLGLAGQGARAQLARKSKWTDRLAIVNLFSFVFLGGFTLMYALSSQRDTNFERESTGFKAAYIGGFVCMVFGGALALASHWHWWGYSSSGAREMNSIGVVPLLMGLVGTLFIWGGIATVWCAIFVIKDLKD